MSEQACFCGSPWFRSMRGRRPLCERHWREWRRRHYARQVRRYPELADDTGYFGQMLEGLGLRRPVQGELFRETGT